MAAGESFARALGRIAGYAMEQLDAEYRSTFSKAGWDSRYYTPPPAMQCPQ